MLGPNFATMFAVYRRLIMSAACRLTHRALQKILNTDVNTNVCPQNTEFYWTNDVCICQTFVFAFTSDVKIYATQSPVPTSTKEVHYLTTSLFFFYLPLKTTKLRIVNRS